MDKGCKNCKHWMVVDDEDGISLSRDFCVLLLQKELMEFMYCSPLERKLARLAERIGIKSCKHFEAKTGDEEQTGYF